MTGKPGEDAVLTSIMTMAAEYNMLPPGARVLCAVSGGADSVCLLHCLYRLRPQLDIRLTAVHYNHGLRGEESDRDERFVAEFIAQCCAAQRPAPPFALGEGLPPVELVIGRGDVAARAAQTGRGVEETARQMRYDFFQETARRLGCDVIATAHTADDNAETLILNLLRGAGLRGLGGIPPVRENVVRPMLGATRQQVEDYLRRQGLPWVEDSTNAQLRYTRNRVRHQITPALRQLAPDLPQKLMDTMHTLRQDEAALSALARAALGRMRWEEGGVSVPAGDVAGQYDAVALRAARLLFAAARGHEEGCTAAHLRAIVRLCRTGGPSSMISLPGGLCARREYDTLLLGPQPSRQAPQAAVLSLPGQTAWGPWRITCRPAVYQGQAQGPWEFYLPQDAGALTVRPRQPGDRLAPPGRPGKTIKKWWIDEKIPAARRSALPVLTAGGQVAAAAGLGPQQTLLPQPGQQAWHIQIDPDGETI